MLAIIVFLYLNETYGKKKENFIATPYDLIDLPKRHYHNELDNAGLIANCPKGDKGCGYDQMYSTSQPYNAKNAFFMSILTTVPKGYVWIETAKGPELLPPPLPPGRIITLSMMAGYSMETINKMVKRGICLTYKICSSDFVQKDSSFMPKEPCDTLPVSLSCLQDLFLSTGCKKTGLGYPSEKNYSQFASAQYSVLKGQAALLKMMISVPNKDLQDKIAPFCTGALPGMPKEPAQQAKPSAVIEECAVKGLSPPPIPFNCVKTQLNKMYVKQGGTGRPPVKR